MKGTFHIADWEVQPQLNCMVRDGRSVHLEPKVMQVLVQLAGHPNEVLSKERLIHAVWPDTFVGDDVLTRSISEIRRVLEDDARAPRFIQTIPKSGYRLIVPVSLDPEPASTEPTAAPEKHPPEPPALTARPEPLPQPVASTFSRVGVIRWVAIAMVVLALAMMGVRTFSRKFGRAESTFKTVPLTSNVGAETQPAFSPDGNQVAYVWNGDADGLQHIYVKLIGTETSLKLTSGPGEDFSPTWSPDGRSIAFLRISPSERGIYVVPAIGGGARKLYTPQGKIEWDRGALSWSPDGKRLVFPDGKSSQSPSAIFSLDLASMDAKPVTSPSNLLDGDFSPAFSPDGTKIAFVRGTEGAVRDIYVMEADGSSEPKRITNDNRFVSGFAWMRNGRQIVFSSDRGGKFSLWRVSIRGGEPERLAVGGDDAFSPAIARSADRLAYTQRSAKWSILKIELKSPKAEPARLLTSTQQDSAPQFSPDGAHIAFQSWRSGTQEIWMGASSGTDLVKLTSFEGPLTGSPSWSPDGQRIAFDSRPNGHSHIYVIGMNGAPPRAITEGDYNDIVPSWSRDGQWIYFGSNRSGSWQIWKARSSGGGLQQVTSQGGFVGSESSDGNWFYFAKADNAGIWRVPASGGEEVKVLNEPGIGFWGYWSLLGNQIFYLNANPSSPAIESFDLTAKRVSRIHALPHVPPPFSGLTVSPDGSSLLFTDLTEAGSHITLVENFQ